MPTERNVAEVEELKALFTEASVLISTDYRGMNVTAMNLLRRALRNGGIKYRISKNTLANIAADAIGRPEIKDLVVGPVGWVYTDADPSAAAKSLVDHIEAERLDMVIHGGLMGDQVLSKEQIMALARLPGREQLLAMLFAQMNAPVAGLATVLAGSIRGLATVLQRISELDGAAEASADEPEAATGDAGAAEASADEPEAATGDAGTAEATADEPEAAAGEAGDAEATADEPDAATGDAGAAEASADEPEAAIGDAGAAEASADEEEAPVEEASGEAGEETEDKSEGEAAADKD